MSCEPDVTTVDLNGSEDFLIVACDGLWDAVSPEEATNSIIETIRTNKGRLTNLHTHLR